MRRIERGIFIACLVVLATLIMGGTCVASATNLRKIVVFWDGTSWQVQQQVIGRSGCQVLNVLPLINGVAIQLPARGTAQALSTLQADPTVEGVYDDPTIAAQGAGTISADGIVLFIQPAPALTQEAYGWGLARIGIPEIQADYPGLDGSGVKVAILDTGIDINHPDLRSNIIGGVNARAGADPSNYQDDNGHGTHIAGIIAAREHHGANKHGVIGAAPHILIYAIKVLDHNGAAQVSDLISGLGWVRANNINLVNMSLGFPQEWGPYPALEKAIKRLYDAGVIMVAAAGNRNPRPVPIAQTNGGDTNGGDTSCSTSQSLVPDEMTAQTNGGDTNGGDGTTFCYKTTMVKDPAAYPWVIAVGATDEHDLVTNYSRSGPEMAAHGVVAPGGSSSRDLSGVLTEGILSTDLGGGYGLAVGTSQATAHVTGTIAMALQLQRNLTFQDILALLRSTATSNGLPANWQGAGVIEADSVVNALQPGHK